MHILLTDRLICPRCGPGFGLILIADRLENRRVIEGSLGCPNCRDRFPVEGGFGDLRPPPRSTRDDAPELEPPASPSAMEVAALLGLTDGPGNVALIGDLAGHATALAGLVPGVEFVGIAPGLRGWEEGEGVSRLNAGASLPFSDGSLRGVGLYSEGDPRMAGELARVVTRDGRIAVWGAVREWENALRSEGLKVLAFAETALVVPRVAP
ncbi:MAG: hypothetical protein IH921_02140 [Gemmatimonadetes bacterium]|nr:hypothetical protein [Gemmatimonadota bacterium]